VPVACGIDVVACSDVRVSFDQVRTSQMGQAPIPYAVTHSEECTAIGASAGLAGAHVANGTGTDPVRCHPF
jgi:hypothetical protein